MYAEKGRKAVKLAKVHLISKYIFFLNALAAQIVSTTEFPQQPSQPHHASDPDVSADPPIGTLLQSYGKTGQRGPGIRILCPPPALFLSG